MKKLLAALLALAMFCASGCVFAEEAARPKLGFLAPYRAEETRDSLRANAFAYAAQREEVEAVIVRYAAANAQPVEPDPDFDEEAFREAEARFAAGGEVAAEGEDDAMSAVSTTEPSVEEAPAEDLPEAEEPAVVALRSLLEEGLDGLVIVPETLDQAVTLVEMAEAAGVPVVVEGLDIAPAYPPTPDPEDVEARPFVANVFYPEGAAAYVAAKWLEEESDNPLLFHCALPVSSRSIQSGLRQALAEARYLSLVDETNAETDSVEGGYDAAQGLVNSYAMFYCVLADSADLAEGCAEALRGDDSMMIAALTGEADALALLGRGVDLLAGEPASLEAMRAFRALLDYLTDGVVPEGENRRIELTAVTATAGDASGWISEGAFEDAYKSALGSAQTRSRD